MNLFGYLTAKTYTLVTATTGISYSVDRAPLSTSVTSGPATTAKDKPNTTDSVPGSTGTAITKTTTQLPSKANKGIAQIE